MKTAWTRAVLALAVLVSGCSDIQRGGLNDGGRGRDISAAGGFWEGTSPFNPAYYYGFTLVQWRGELFGTCFQGGPDIRVYYIERCTIEGNCFKGWKTYAPANLSEAIEGTFDGNSCRLVEHYTDGRGIIDLHRVGRLSRMPNVFREPVEETETK